MTIHRMIILLAGLTILSCNQTRTTREQTVIQNAILPTMNAEVASSDTITGLFNRALTDKERVQQIQKEVDEINAMPLVSDTVSLAVLYFDKQGQLRKYFAQYEEESGRGKTVACYDNNGDIIYYEYDGGPNCAAYQEHYFVHEGRIIDGSYHYECYCCEDEDGTLLDIDTTYQVAGSLFVERMDDEWDKNYLRADSLLNLVAGDTYGITDAYPLALPAIIPRKQAEHGYRYYDSLQSIKAIYTSIIMIDSIDNPKAYLYQYSTNAGFGIAVKNEDKYVEFGLRRGLHEYTIERMNLDGIGSDELIIRNKYKYDKTEQHERGGFEIRDSSEWNYIEIWDIDSFSCLLFIQDKYMRSGWHYDLSGKILAQSHECREFIVNLDEKRLSIQKVENGRLGLTYKYIFTKSGYVLDRVE